MDETIHQLTTKFLKTLSVNLGKTTSKANLGGGNEVLADPSLQIIIHMISCTRSLRDAFELSTGGSSAPNNGSNSVKKPKNPIFSQLYQPMLNGILALLGKMLMDSFSFEPKVTDTAVFSAAYGILGRHILTLFPEMATKKHKVSGKMLIHHAVYKARPEIAEETVGHILKVSPISARAEDATGALPLHWATRNPDISFELIDLLLKSYPEAPTKADNKGFLPLHWAVNQDNPNVEVVRKLIKIFPAAAGMPSYSGNLPLHYCVSRARPSIPVIKALIAAYPEAIRSGCEDGYLPLHRYLYRPLVDLDALRLLINYFPDALLAKSNRNQTPLHVAVDHHSPDALAVDLLLQVCPSAISIVDSDRYLPLHLCLDCAEPNYALALQLLTQYPQAASCATKDEMLPLHLLVGANSDPTHEHSQHQQGGSSGEGANDAVAFVTALLQAYPQALVTTVKDIIPAIDGVALADPESWSGEWVESYWSPLTRARDRGLSGLVQVFQSFQQSHGIRDPLSSAAGPVSSQASAQGPSGGGGSSNSSRAGAPASVPAAPAVTSNKAPVALWPSAGANTAQLPGAGNSTGSNGSPQHEIIPFHQDFRLPGSNNNISNSTMNTSNEYMSHAAVPVKSQPLNNNNTNNNAYSGVNPIRFTSPASPPGSSNSSHNNNNNHNNRVTSGGNDAYDAGNESTNDDEQVVITNRTARLSKPTGKVPPHILKAQASAAASARASSAGGSVVSGGGSNRGGSQNGDSRASSREHERQRAQQQAYLQHQYQVQQQQRRAGSAGGNQSDQDNDLQGAGNQQLEMSLVMESVYSVGPERSRDSTPMRQQQNYTSAPAPAPIPVPNATSYANNKAPPPGPIPASLLQAAENNAMRHARAQQQQQQQGGDLANKGSSKRSKPVITASSSNTNASNNDNASPQRMPRARSYNNNNNSNNNNYNNNMESPPLQQQQQLASTTGLGRYDASDNRDNNDPDSSAKYRVATAPAQGDKDKNRTQARVLGFGKNAAWSAGEETAANSVDGTDNVNANRVNNTSNNSNVDTSAMNAKQQRLLQAQQQYMKRAGSTSSNVNNNASGTSGSTNFNLVRTKPGAPSAQPQLQIQVPDNAESGADNTNLTLKPISYHRTVATNHTSEIMKSMGGAGKVRIHPVSKPVVNNNTSNSNVDEMV